MKIGRIVSAEKDLYFIAEMGEDGRASLRRLIPAKGRGALRNDKHIAPMVGDVVSFEYGPARSEARILSVHPRKNVLLRPPVSNVDQALVVQTIVEPMISSVSFDRSLAVLERRGLPILLCFNKQDLVDSSLSEKWVKRYADAGYPVYAVSAHTGENLEQLRRALQDKVTAISGPSGAGKSSLIRKMTGKSSIEIGNLSRRGLRGKQTTRRIQLFELDASTFLFDTPGFSTIDLRDFSDPIELVQCFPEIRSLSIDCRFRNCTHRHEPGCVVRKALAQERLDPVRYQSYCVLFEEIEKQKRF